MGAKRGESLTLVLGEAGGATPPAYSPASHRPLALRQGRRHSGGGEDEDSIAFLRSISGPRPAVAVDEPGPARAPLCRMEPLLGTPSPECRDHGPGFTRLAGVPCLENRSSPEAGNWRLTFLPSYEVHRVVSPRTPAGLQSLVGSRAGKKGVQCGQLRARPALTPATVPRRRGRAYRTRRRSSTTDRSRHIRVLPIRCTNSRRQLASLCGLLVAFLKQHLACRPPR
jgi:hypothetical protein